MIAKRCSVVAVTLDEARSSPGQSVEHVRGRSSNPNNTTKHELRKSYKHFRSGVGVKAKEEGPGSRRTEAVDERLTSLCRGTR